ALLHARGRRGWRGLAQHLLRHPAPAAVGAAPAPTGDRPREAPRSAVRASRGSPPLSPTGSD
ncbi:MAG: hypothetical protein SF182_13780, partial [Deltaproteobacteria bacterium]|nr:hypothetical protein [Deltaproteobacteria bacterium]